MEIRKTPEVIIGWEKCELPGHPNCSWCFKWGQSCGPESLTCSVCTKSELLGTQLMLENWMIGVEKNMSFMSEKKQHRS